MCMLIPSHAEHLDGAVRGTRRKALAIVVHLNVVYDVMVTRLDRLGRGGHLCSSAARVRVVRLARRACDHERADNPRVRECLQLGMVMS